MVYWNVQWNIHAKCLSKIPKQMTHWCSETYQELFFLLFGFGFFFFTWVNTLYVYATDLLPPSQSGCTVNVVFCCLCHCMVYTGLLFGVFMFTISLSLGELFSPRSLANHQAFSLCCNSVFVINEQLHCFMMLPVHVFFTTTTIS